MGQIRLEQFGARFGEDFTIKNVNWQVSSGQHWVVLGANGSGKSALAAALLGEGEEVQGTRQVDIHRTSLVSFDQQKAMLEQELKKDGADILDIIPQATRVRELLLDGADESMDMAFYQRLITLFGFEKLLDRGFRALSTGETRKLLLIRALRRRPELIVLDEPFDGLDATTCARLSALLAELSGQLSMVLVLNRLDEIPDFATHFAYMEHGELTHTVARTDTAAVDSLYQLLHLKTSELEIPPTDGSQALPPLDPVKPLVRMSQVAVRYADATIFEGVDWTIRPGQHWQLTGPNGCGKTCLLNLITGDHPQCYANDIMVFGFQRGSGESIWQIKQYIGYVSNTLHLDYRVGATLRNTIISGFYDSIGLYQTPSLRQRQLADQWLALLGLGERAGESFTRLSFGDQRLVLIARAMVKHPPLLILDEPCQGLDDINRQRVLALIERICAAGHTTVLYVNHHANDRIRGIEHHFDLTRYSQNVAK